MMPVSRTVLWTGRILSGLVIAFLLMDGGIKLVPIKEVTETLQSLAIAAASLRRVG